MTPLKDLSEPSAASLPHLRTGRIKNNLHKRVQLKYKQMYNVVIPHRTCSNCMGAYVFWDGCQGNVYYKKEGVFSLSHLSKQVMCAFCIAYNWSHQHKKLLERGSKIHEKTGARSIYISRINTTNENYGHEEWQNSDELIILNSAMARPYSYPDTIGESYTPRALGDVICGTMFVRGHALVRL